MGHLLGIVEDNDKFLLIADGKPLVVTDKKDQYTKDDVSKLFKDFKKIDLQILHVKEGDSQSLEVNILSNNARKMNIKGKDISLDVNPILKEGQIILPLEQISRELGLNYSQSGD